MALQEILQLRKILPTNVMIAVHFKYLRWNPNETIGLPSARSSSKFAAACVGFRTAECRSGTSVHQADCEAIRMCLLTEIFEKDVPTIQKLIFSVAPEMNLDIKCIVKLLRNKKVLLRERKRHTAHRVASAWGVPTLGYPLPHPDLGGRGYLPWGNPPSPLS